MFQPDLATSLNNLSVQLSILGQREAVLAAIREAVELRRQLAARNPDAFQPDLATSLNNLGNMLRTIGERVGGRQLGPGRRGGSRDANARLAVGDRERMGSGAATVICSTAAVDGGSSRDETWAGEAQVDQGNSATCGASFRSG